MNLTIKTFRGDTYIEEMTTVESVIKIGRLKSSHVCLDDEAVARMHAVIEVSGEEVKVIDLGSATGTILNGTKIHKNAMLESRDVLAFGPYRLMVKFGATSESVLRTATEMRAHLTAQRLAAAARAEEEAKEAERRFEQEVKEDLAVLLPPASVAKPRAPVDPETVAQAQRVHNAHMELCRNDINAFTEYVLRDEVTGARVKQAPIHLRIQKLIRKHK